LSNIPNIRLLAVICQVYNNNKQIRLRKHDIKREG
jgi:hypothetical protein